MSNFFGCIVVVVLGFTSAVQAYDFDSNVPENIRNQTIADLSFLSSVQASATSNLNQVIFGDANGNNSGEAYMDFFNSRVKNIGMNSCGGGKAVACYIPGRPNRIYFTNNYVKFSHPQVTRLAVVIHEARHTEVQNGSWMHSQCPKPFLDPNGKPYKSIWTGAELAGEMACDVTPIGSYGTGLIYLKNIAKFCTNCNEKVLLDSGIYADDTLDRIIDATAKQQIIDDLYR